MTTTKELFVTIVAGIMEWPEDEPAFRAASLELVSRRGDGDADARWYAALLNQFTMDGLAAREGADTSAYGSYIMH